MCGLFGYVLSRARRGPLPDLALAARALHHRGPDDAGTFEEAAGDWAIGFAHTRLAILDLTPAGHQPMTSRDGRYVIVYNGEIYNFATVRAELESLGERFASNCDTEVLLAAYARWGKGCLARLRGMFAFAVWDKERRSLFLARDRLGVKPLYYVAGKDGVAFASEVRVLLETGVAERKLSPDGLSTYLMYGSVREPETILRDVRSLPGGCTLEYEPGRAPRIERYWTLPLNQEHAPTEDVAAKLRGILVESVRLRLIADVPVGVFLSGGVDSAALVALASLATSAPVHTFTVTFDAADDEGQAAAAVARRFGCVHREAHLETNVIGADIALALAALDQPSADGVNTFFVSKAARSAGLVVALSGIGGDELFAGYSGFRRFAQVRALWRLRLPRFARGAVAQLTRAPAVPREVRKALALLDAVGNVEATYEAFRGMFVPSQRDALVVPEFLGAHVNGAKSMDGAIERALDAGELDSTNAFGALEISNYLGHTLLRDTDAMSMAHSLEVREPLVDHELVECAMRIPGATKLEGVGSKPLLARAVPEIGMDARLRKKRGFELPFDAWLRGPLHGWAQERLLGSAGRNADWLRRDTMAALWKNFDGGGGGVSWSRVWCLAALVDWCERHHVRA